METIHKIALIITFSVLIIVIVNFISDATKNYSGLPEQEQQHIIFEEPRPDQTSAKREFLAKYYPILSVKTALLTAQNFPALPLAAYQTTTQPLSDAAAARLKAWSLQALETHYWIKCWNNLKTTVTDPGALQKQWLAIKRWQCNRIAS